MDLSYIIEKIKKTKLSEFPFKHLEINELFDQKDFEKIIGCPEIATKAAQDDNSLFRELFASDYKIINFPGSTTDYKEYLRWHKDKRNSHRTNTSCEGYGVVLRLESIKTKELKEVNDFFNSTDFLKCIAGKFDLNTGDCNYDAGIQKYLDGYEISPHPDIRRKALTFMVNINPGQDTENRDHHTSYLQFKPEWNYVAEFWKGNPKLDRFWVPWDWCEIKKEQRANNSMVIFSPDYNTLHAVKAEYDHLSFQRTQLYGNLWYHESPAGVMPMWEDVILKPGGGTVKSSLKKYLPESIIKNLKKLKGAYSESTHAKRDY